MPIPIESKRAEKITREIARLQDQITGASVRVRKHLCKALIYATMANNGDAGATDMMEAELDLARAEGMVPDAIKSGPGMAGKIATLLDRSEAHARAAGLLFVAADLLSEAGVGDALAIRDTANAIASPEDAAKWAKIAQKPPHIIHTHKEPTR